ncbi:MAG: metal-dependent hydrolase [Vicinamibacterales bacterium]
MPSPIGHGLGGLITGQAFRTRTLLLTTLLAAAPDLDFLWGRHSMETHSLGAAALVGLVALAATRGREPRLALACAVAWASHVLFDWLGADTAPPLGVMALWPFSTDFYFAHAYVFDAIDRRYWRPGFVAHNVMAVIREIVMLGPIAVALWWWGRRESVDGRLR